MFLSLVWPCCKKVTSARSSIHVFQFCRGYTFLFVTAFSTKPLSRVLPMIPFSFSFFWNVLMTNKASVYTIMHVKLCVILVISSRHRPADRQLTKTPTGRRTSLSWASTDVSIRKRRPASVKLMTTPKKILKKRPVPGRFHKSPMICKSKKNRKSAILFKIIRKLWYTCLEPTL